MSYARGSSVAPAQALAARLGADAFLDVSAIDEGEAFPERLLTALLDARVVVVFATETYLTRRFCRLELRLALAADTPGDSRIVLALGDGAASVLAGLPPALATRNWPQAGAIDDLEQLVRRQLAQHRDPLRAGLDLASATRLAAAFLDESGVPEPRSLAGLRTALPPGSLARSLGSRFVGRASDLRAIHAALWTGPGDDGRRSGRITSGGGFGKTRLAMEYLHRFGPHSYRAGLFWINASAGSLEEEWWRIIAAFDPHVPDASTLRKQGRDIRRLLEGHLRSLDGHALLVIDDVPESAASEEPVPLSHFCPATDALTVLATSRQDTREPGVAILPVATLQRDAAILLLTEGLNGFGGLAWDAWGEIAAWVGDLPLALDLLNRSLALHAVTPTELLERARAPQASGATPTVVALDRLRNALRGQVPSDAVRGITETFEISFDRLDPQSRTMASFIACLAAEPVPHRFVNEVIKEEHGAAIRATLTSRHFVTDGDDMVLGTMHPLLATFLRERTGQHPEVAHDLITRACLEIARSLTVGSLSDPSYFGHARLLRPHAETLFARFRDGAEALEASTAGLGASQAAYALGDYAASARLAEAVLETRMRVAPDNGFALAQAMSQLATAHHSAGNLSAARDLDERVLRMDVDRGEDARSTTQGNLAGVLHDQGEYARAKRLGEEVLAFREGALGPDHPDTLLAAGNLATTVFELGDYAAARRLQERVVEASTRISGLRDQATLRGMQNLAVTLNRLGEHERAEAMARTVVREQARLFGKDHPNTFPARNLLASMLGDADAHAPARALFEELFDSATRSLGLDHPTTLRFMSNLAAATEAFDLTEARRLHEDVLQRSRRIKGERHPDTIHALSKLGFTAHALGDVVTGGRLLAQALALRREVLGEDHPETVRLREILNRPAARGGFVGRLTRAWQGLRAAKKS